MFYMHTQTHTSTNLHIKVIVIEVSNLGGQVALVIVHTFLHIGIDIHEQCFRGSYVARALKKVIWVIYGC